MIAWLLAILAVEAVVEIIIDSELFVALRVFIVRANPSFLGKLFTCGYCMSVWVAASIAWSLPGSVCGNDIINIIIRTFVLHRASNVLHELLSRYFKRLPLMVVFNLVNNPGFEQGNNNEQDEPGETGGKL